MSECYYMSNGLISKILIKIEIFRVVTTWMGNSLCKISWKLDENWLRNQRNSIILVDEFNVDLTIVYWFIKYTHMSAWKVNLHSSTFKIQVNLIVILTPTRWSGTYIYRGFYTYNLRIIFICADTKPMYKQHCTCYLKPSRSDDSFWNFVQNLH